jgi:hypothetical protein
MTGWRLDVDSCEICKRKLGGDGLQLTRNERLKNGYCVCNAPPVLTSVDQNWMVWQMMHYVPNTFCGDYDCKECRR